eukprot:g1011.t1
MDHSAAGQEQHHEGHEEEEEEEWEALAEFDLYEALRIPCVKDKPCDTRARGAYHRLATMWNPNLYVPVRSGNKTTVEQQYEAATKQFRRVTLAYLVLKDAPRKQIYDTGGWQGLKMSEGYQSTSVFEEADYPYDIFEAFFEGRDQADRDYLLLNGNALLSDDEAGQEEAMESGDEEEQDEAEELAVLEAVAAAKAAGGDAEMTDASSSSSSSSSSAAAAATAEAGSEGKAAEPEFPAVPSSLLASALLSQGVAAGGGGAAAGRGQQDVVPGEEVWNQLEPVQSAVVRQEEEEEEQEEEEA